MPEQQRRALLLREWQGLSYKEIGERARSLAGRRRDAALPRTSLARRRAQRRTAAEEGGRASRKRLRRGRPGLDPLDRQVARPHRRRQGRDGGRDGGGDVGRRGDAGRRATRSRTSSRRAPTRRRCTRSARRRTQARARPRGWRAVLARSYPSCCRSARGRERPADEGRDEARAGTAAQFALRTPRPPLA